MGAVNEGKSGTALLLTGTNKIPDYCVLGTGSSSFSVTDTDLNTPVHWATFDSTDATTVNKVIYTTTFDSVTASGTAAYKELGVFTSGASSINTLWGKEAFAGNAITADGTIEIQIQYTMEIW